MKAASLADLKKELKTLSSAELLELCMRMAKYKKDNKELLTYLIFEAGNEQAYICEIKTEMDEQFKEINNSNAYLAKKSLRKILRSTSKYIKYSGSKETELELLIYFCKKIKTSGINKFIHSNSVLTNIYLQQIKKINKALSGLHEDLQYDYQRQIENLH
jgi:hypothetical protein